MVIGFLRFINDPGVFCQAFTVKKAWLYFVRNPERDCISFFSVLSTASTDQGFYSRIAQRQSRRLLTAGLEVRILLWELKAHTAISATVC